VGSGRRDLSSWTTWFSVGKAVYAEPLSRAERRAFAKVSGDRAPPRKKVREFVAAISRRAGKGRMVAAMATYEAALVDHSDHLAPGETGIVGIISPTRSQAKVVQNYCLGFLQASPVLRDEVASVTDDEIRLKNGVVIATLVADYRSLRGRTLLLAILDEAGFLPDETSAASDIEAARALRPALTTTGGTLYVISSPYRRSGLLFQRHRDYFGENDDRILVVSGASTDFNPTLDVSEIDAARADDPEGVTAEYDGQFRRDSASFLDEASIEAAIDRSRPLELGPKPGIVYFAFIDVSGGVGRDSYTISIVHREGDLLIVDLVRGSIGRVNPFAITEQYAALCKEYRIRFVTGDSYGQEWVAEAWRKAGISFRDSDVNKSEIFVESIVYFTRNLVRMPDHSKLLRELRLLQRKPQSSGKDKVDHPRGGHDDYPNAVCGALRLIGVPRRHMTKEGIEQKIVELSRLAPRLPFGERPIRSTQPIRPLGPASYPPSWLRPRG
jgi:hypothetical protein